MRSFAIVLFCNVCLFSSAGAQQTPATQALPDTDSAAAPSTQRPDSGIPFARFKKWEPFPLSPLAGSAAGASTARASILSTKTSNTIATPNTDEDVSASVSTYTITGKQVLQSSGTFMDLTRYLHSLPGVFSNIDLENTAIVRGGNPFENLYVLDQIEIPNINYLALANSSGGLVSMIDPSLVEAASLYTGIYNSGYASRLSSVLDIHTNEVQATSSNEIEAGFGGFGGHLSRAIGSNSTVTFGLRQSFLNPFTSNLGLNGIPTFTNTLTRYTWKPSSRDAIWIDTLSGRDSLAMRPSRNDASETNAYDTDYSGWRNTTGLVWQRQYESSAVGTWVISNSEQSQHLSQRDQITSDQLIFQQNNLDGVSQLRYDYLKAFAGQAQANGGFDLHLNRIHYKIAQPVGLLSPYSASTEPVAAFSATPGFNTLDKAAYLDMVLQPAETLTIRAGIRAEQWGYAGTSSATAPSSATATDTSSSSATCCCAGPVMPAKQAIMPHITASNRLSRRFSVKAGYGRYAQLPPYATLTGPASNSSLQLIHSSRYIAGADFVVTKNLALSIEAYRKSYSDYPVSTDFSSLSLATIIPTLGQVFAVLPMTSAGKGIAQGIEISARHDVSRHLFGQANLSFSGSRFSGSDGILRRSGYDFPLALNAAGGITARGFIITIRDTLTSGRPYTPILPVASEQQNRSIYDLTQLNAQRGPLYNRLDLGINKSFMFGKKRMEAHLGVINAFDRDNFYDYAWRPRCPQCGPIRESQIGITPDFGVNYHF